LLVDGGTCRSLAFIGSVSGHATSVYSVYPWLDTLPKYALLLFLTPPVSTLRRQVRWCPIGPRGLAPIMDHPMQTYDQGLALDIELRLVEVKAAIFCPGRAIVEPCLQVKLVEEICLTRG
jgi:hypothetical protein